VGNVLPVQRFETSLKAGVQPELGLEIDMDIKAMQIALISIAALAALVLLMVILRSKADKAE
jgi:hypothetical protein